VSAYYNEIDAYAAQWLRNLAAAGHIADGEVDERDIAEVCPGDLKGFTQCHFFAGIGGWSLALRIAGWPDERPVWTGSAPCQPFSAAGRGKAADDERHLWPAWFSLIRECRPPGIFGEQVEAAIGWGWLDAVFADLEAEGYACGAAVLPACSVGAPHIRQRVWFVAVAAAQRAGAPTGDLAHPQGQGRPQRYARADARTPQGPERLRDASELGDAVGPRLQEQRGNGSLPTVAGAADIWSDVQWLPCADGKARPTKPGFFPLAHGVSARVGKLRAAGNAIVPQVAAEFIRASS
jgi:DNA (cytosine-5)-methyltransferase 1